MVTHGKRFGCGEYTCHPLIDPSHHKPQLNQTFLIFSPPSSPRRTLSPVSAADSTQFRRAMEVINAATSAPIHRPVASSGKNPKFPPKTPNFIQQTHNRITKGLATVTLSSISAAAAKALTYDEALAQSGGSDSSPFGGFSLDPLVIGGAVLALAVPLILTQVFGGKSSKFAAETPRNAYARLSEDPSAELVDIREKKEIRESGTPDLRSLKKKVTSIGYNRDDKLGFLKKLGFKFKNPENTTLVILDTLNGDSEMVAELVTLNGFKAAYAVRDGTEGPRGWKNSELPWSSPKKSLLANVDIDISGFTEAITGVFGGVEQEDNLPVFGLAAVAGLSLLAVSEIETLLQLLGSIAFIQFSTKKLLFAEDRKVTLKKVDEFLTNEIAPLELVSDIKTIGMALLPISINTLPSLPAPVEITLPPPVVEAVAAVEPPHKPSSGTACSLSPFPSYSDFKPPCSPAPSKP